MLVQVYLTVEEGMDHVSVSTARPLHYKPQEGRRGLILRADIPVPDIERVDGILRIKSSMVKVLEFVPGVEEIEKSTAEDSGVLGTEKRLA